MTNLPSKTFCALPWIHSFVNINGNFQVCCTAEEFHQAITDDSGKAFNISNQPTLDQVMNSQYMKDIRLQMLAGKFPSICERCVTTEKMGGTGSRRLVENLKASESMDIMTLAENTKSDGEISIKINSADYRLGNACNLKCRMCHPNSSIAWLGDWKKVKNPSEWIPPELEAQYSSFDWINQDYLLDDLRSKAPHLEYLHFAGGEPLFAPRMAEMLEVCIESGFAKNICLSYNTNLTRIPKKIKELWPKFKAIKLLCSIDGYGSVNDYIRTNAKWSVIDENLKMLNEEFESLKISQIILSTTVQASNILNLTELYEYISKLPNTVKALNLINLYGPEYLRTQVLPKEIKEEAKRRLLEIKPMVASKLEPHMMYLLNGIDEAINFMEAADKTEMLPEFIKYNYRIDAIEKASFKDSIPDLYQMLKKNQTIV